MEIENESGPVSLHIKWGKKTFDIATDASQTVAVLKDQLFTLTGVPQPRQKLTAKGITGLLKNDQTISTLNLNEKTKILLIGSAEVLKAAPSETEMKKFIDTPSNNVKEAVFTPGMRNLGNTCYLNATIQALNAIPELHEALLTYKENGARAHDPNHNITVASRELFKTLKKNVSKEVLPSTLIQQFHRAHPAFAEKNEKGVPMQQDADEFLILLLAAFRAKLKQGDRNLIESLFHGKLDFEAKCAEEGGETITEAKSFEKLQVFIEKDIQVIEAGLEKGFKGQMERKSDTLGRDAVFNTTQHISDLPPFVVVQFTRFQWKTKENVRAKILRNVKYGQTLDLQYLCNSEVKAATEANRAKLREFEDERLKLEEESKPAKSKPSLPSPSSPDFRERMTGRYRLASCVTHTGVSAEGGHYIGWARAATKGGKPDKTMKDEQNSEKNPAWLKFDDAKVSEVDSNAVLACSGGAETPITYILVYKAEAF